MDMHEDQQFLESMVKALVDNPDAVKTSRAVDEMGVLLTLDVHPEDMGKIIGRSGNTAKAIRTLLRVAGMKHDARVNLKINEPEGGMRSTVPNNDFGGGDAVGDGTKSTDTNASIDGDEGKEQQPKSLDEAIDDLKI